MAATLRNQAGVGMGTTSACSAVDATDSETIWPHPADHTTAARTTVHRKSDQRGDDLYVGGLPKRAWNGQAICCIARMGVVMAPYAEMA